jgi:hypothetical protein
MMSVENETVNWLHNLLLFLFINFAFDISKRCTLCSFSQVPTYPALPVSVAEGRQLATTRSGRKTIFEPWRRRSKIELLPVGDWDVLLK